MSGNYGATGKKHIGVYSGRCFLRLFVSSMASMMSGRWLSKATINSSSKMAEVAGISFD